LRKPFVLTIVATSRWNERSGKSRFLLIPREKAKKLDHVAQDEESRALAVTEKKDEVASSSCSSNDTRINDQLIHNTSVFTWKNLMYTVKTLSGNCVLLDNIQGWVKPGILGALMGSSGHRKTTLLDILAQHKTEGTISRSILVDS
jgi:ATP-binding cassette, subfamily G (WHITE), member 2, SNQ2